MSYEQDDRKNEKYVNLVKKVNTLSKIVNELQAEVDGLKSRACKPNDKCSQIPEEPKIENKDPPKTSRFQRLNFFRRDNKTKEKSTEAKPNNSENLQIKGNENASAEVHDRTTSTDNKKQSTDQPPVTELSKDENNRRNRSTQSAFSPKEVEFSCIVQTCGMQTQNKFENSASSQETTESESNFNEKIIKPTCAGCDKSKCTGCNMSKKQKIKATKLKTGRCAKDCPYLVKDNKDVKENKKKHKSKNKDASVESCCKDQSHISKKKKCKNKKTMVNFVKDDKVCSPLQNQPASSPISTLHLLDHDGKCVEVKDTYCKRCLKKCKTKNVLKINKAILTHEPPVVIMSPRKC